MNHPILPLRDIVVFPHMIVPLFVGRDKSVQALEDAMNKKKEIVLVAQKKSSTEDPTEKDLFVVGTIGIILQLLKLPDGTVKVLVEGKQRVNIKRFIPSKTFLKAEIVIVDDKNSDNIDNAKINVLHTVFEDYINLNKKTNNELINLISEIKNP